MSLVRRSTLAGPWIANGASDCLRRRSRAITATVAVRPSAAPLQPSARPAVAAVAPRRGREQLRGVAAGVRRLADARRASATARRPARRRRRRSRAPPCVRCRSVATPFHGLLHHDLRVGERRHLREVGDAQHLVPRAECRSRRPTATPASPPMPGVDLVEHQRRRRLREHHARRQHRTGELAAGRGPGQRAGRARPGWARAGR